MSNYIAPPIDLIDSEESITIKKGFTDMVRLADVVKSNDFKNAVATSFVVGADDGGKTTFCDLKDIGNILVAGFTATGKSCFLQALIVSLIYHASIDEVRFVLVDTMGCEFTALNGMPHLLNGEVLENEDDVLAALNWSVNEAKNRSVLFEKAGVKNIDEYKALGKSLYRVVVIIDEIGYAMRGRNAGKIEAALNTLKGFSNDVGIHIVFNTKQINSATLSENVLSCFSTKVLFKTQSAAESQLVIGTDEAMNLAGSGQMLFKKSVDKKAAKLQGAFVSGREIETLIEYLYENSDFDFIGTEEITNSVY
ncbi:MAG: FtsK/SpoIIIE domain-containing protein [Christensenellales bacterium]